MEGRNASPRGEREIFKNRKSNFRPGKFGKCSTTNILSLKKLGTSSSTSGSGHFNNSALERQLRQRCHTQATLRLLSLRQDRNKWLRDIGKLFLSLSTCLSMYAGMQLNFICTYVCTYSLQFN
jgi:hypothetical protein